MASQTDPRPMHLTVTAPAETVTTASGMSTLEVPANGPATTAFFARFLKQWRKDNPGTT